MQRSAPLLLIRQGHRKSVACTILIPQSSNKTGQHSSGDHVVINIHKQGGQQEPLTAYQLFYLILHGFYVNAFLALYTLLRSTGKVRGHVLTHRCC